MSDNDKSGEEPTINKVVSLAQFRKEKEVPKGDWPAAIPKADRQPVTISAKDPQERRILLSLTHGDIIVDGYLGLSQTFLAVGDKAGAIKFAAAGNMWQYATDVTDDPEYADSETFIELVPEDAED